MPFAGLSLFLISVLSLPSLLPADPAQLFSLSFVLHFVQMIYSRMPWLCLMLVACGLEVAGWSSRLVAAGNPFTQGMYVLSTTVLFFGPVFMSATLYFILSTFVQRFAEPFCRIHWRWIVRGFVTCDVLSLFIQGGGGGWAAGDPDNANPGIHMMLGGMCIQVFGMTVYTILGLDVAWHVWRRKEVDPRDRSLGVAAENGKAGPDIDENGFVVPTARRPRMIWRDRLPAEAFGRLPIFGIGWRLFAVSVSICTALLLMRCGYRIAELAHEWRGALFDDEIWFDLMDGLPMVIVCLLLNVFHPVMVFGRGTWRSPKSGSEVRRRRRPALFWLTCGICGRGSTTADVIDGPIDANGGDFGNAPLQRAAQQDGRYPTPSDPRMAAPPATAGNVAPTNVPAYGEVRVAGADDMRW